MLDAAMSAIEAGPGPVPMVLIGHPAMLADLRDIVAAIDPRPAAEIDWTVVASGGFAPVRRSVLLVETRGLDQEALAGALPRVDAAAAALDCPLVVSVDEAAIDLVAAGLFGPRVQLLCRPTRADGLAALVVARRQLEPRGLNDPVYEDDDAIRFKRLNEEVARIADALSRLTQRDAGERRGLALADNRPGYGVEPVEDVAIDPAEIRRAIRGRRLRDQFFGAGLFEEPGWDMLLDLFAAELEQTRVSVSSLCIAAAVAPTTALRWISKLTEAGLFVRRPDPFDRRRAYMELSPRASRAMRDYVGTLRRAGLSLA